METFINLLNCLITLSCLIIQYRGIRAGKYDSSLASWSIWSCIFAFLTVIYFVEVGLTALTILLTVQTIGHFIMIFATWKYVERSFVKEERTILGVAIGGFVLWAVSYALDINPIIATVIGITGQLTADAMGSIPYFRIVWNRPNRQPLSAWILNFFIYPLTAYIVMINNESWTSYIMLAYGFLLYGLCMLGILIYRKGMMKSTS